MEINRAYRLELHFADGSRLFFMDVPDGPFANVIAQELPIRLASFGYYQVRCSIQTISGFEANFSATNAYGVYGYEFLRAEYENRINQLMRAPRANNPPTYITYTSDNTSSPSMFVPITDRKELERLTGPLPEEIFSEKQKAKRVINFEEE